MTEMPDQQRWAEALRSTTGALVLAAELYDHHSAGFGEDVSAGLPDHAAAHQEQGAAPLTCQPRLRRGPSLASLITALTGDRLTPWPDGRYG